MDDCKNRSRDIHPGYFLPTVAGGFVAAKGAVFFGLPGVAWMSFGVAFLSWLVIGSITMNRLMQQASLPPARIPTLAIEVAPAVVGGAAYFALTNGKIDSIAYGLAGYALLMILAQIRMIPLYLRTAFTPSYWAFTFSYAVAAADALLWIERFRFTGSTLLSSIILIAITTLTGCIFIRSLTALYQRTFIPIR